MKKLTSKQVEKIKKLRAEGKTIAELLKMFNVLRDTISHHTNPNFRNSQKAYQKKRYKNRSIEQKKKSLEERREYQRDYHKNRYKNDEEFRKKHLIQVKGSKKNE